MVARSVVIDARRLYQVLLYPRRGRRCIQDQPEHRSIPNVAAPGVDLSISNLAYGGQLKLYAAFGTVLADGDPSVTIVCRMPDKPYLGKHPPDSAFQPITMPASGLNDTRVAMGTFLSETYNLGPKTVGTQPGLYGIPSITIGITRGTLATGSVGSMRRIRVATSCAWRYSISWATS